MTASDEAAPILARIPPPVWALLYMATAWGISALANLAPVPLLHQPMLGRTLALGSAALAGWAMLTFRRAGTEIMPSSATNKTLVTHGPFRHTRNPMYCAIAMLTLGVAFLFGTLPFFVVTILVVITNDQVTIPYEEAKMERQFGEAFRAYKQKVRRWL